jgi:tetratricopeptide (TPR) repeat protein
MPEPVHAAMRSSQAIALIESSPLAPGSWEKLAEKVRGQNDPLSVKSLEVIIDGLKKLEEASQLAERNKTPAPRLSGMSQSMFVRLAKAYNSPTLLKEIGLIYLRDLNLPDVALRHFERSQLLGGPEKELRPLTEAAAVAVQRQIARRDGQEPAHSGIITAQHARPIAPNIIRKTGKMLLPARFPAAATPRVAETESELAEPLPATTAECLAGADAAIKKGHFRRAEALLQKANQQPADAADMWQAWTNLGQAHYEAGDYPEVQATFLQALKYGPEEMASHFNVGLGYHLNKKYELAIAAYSRANELEARHPKVWCNLGVLYFQMDSYDKAEQALRCAVEADPQYARAWDNLAASLGAQDKLDDAIDACVRAVELRPDYPEAYFKMGVIYFTKDQLELAATEFRRAALLPALTAYCDAFLAMVHARLEQPEVAEADVRRATLLDPKCDLLWMAWNDIGLAWYTEKNYPRAAVAYGEGTVLKPDEPEAWFNLGVSHHRTGNLQGARECYQRAVDLRNTLAGAWHNLGIICAETNDLPAAQLAFQREVASSPQNIRAWYDLGVTYEKLGKAAEAREAFARADALGGTEGIASPVDPAAKRSDATSNVPLPPGLNIQLPERESMISP